MALKVMLIRDDKNGALIQESKRESYSIYTITLVNNWGDTLDDQHLDKFSGPPTYSALGAAVNEALRVLKEIDGE